MTISLLFRMSEQRNRLPPSHFSQMGEGPKSKHEHACGSSGGRSMFDQKVAPDHRRNCVGKGIFLWNEGHVVSNWFVREMLVQDMWNMKELSNYRPNATC